MSHKHGEHFRTTIPQSFWGIALGGMEYHKRESYLVAKIEGRDTSANLDITNEALVLLNNIMQEDDVTARLSEIYEKYKHTQPALIAIASPFTDDHLPNPIPLTTAMLISSYFKGKAKKEGILKPGGFDYKRIIQYHKEFKKTGQDFYARAVAYSSFRECTENDLTGIKEAIIIDDHVSIGGTVADAFAYLLNKGIKPTGCMATTGPSKKIDLPIKPDMLKKTAVTFGLNPERSLSEERKNPNQEQKRVATDAIARKIFNLDGVSHIHAFHLLTNLEIKALGKLFDKYRQENRIKKTMLNPAHILEFGKQTEKMLQKARETSTPIKELPLEEIRRRIGKPPSIDQTI